MHFDEMFVTIPIVKFTSTSNSNSTKTVYNLLLYNEGDGYTYKDGDFEISMTYDKYQYINIKAGKKCKIDIPSSATLNSEINDYPVIKWEAFIYKYNYLYPLGYKKIYNSDILSSYNGIECPSTCEFEIDSDTKGYWGQKIMFGHNERIMLDIFFYAYLQIKISE